MEDLQKLLKELEEVTKTNETKTQPQNSTQIPQANQTTQNTVDNSGVEEQFKAWKEIGLIRFGSQYGHLKNFSKILNLVIPKADQKVLADIQAGRVEDEYFDYLEKAYQETIREIASFSKDLLSSQIQTNKQRNTPTQPQTPSYRMEDYYNDYKKFLEKITAKDVAVIKFLDGVEDGGKIRQTGVPRSTIYENVNLEN
jgi:hypothetical protein